MWMGGNGLAPFSAPRYHGYMNWPLTRFEDGDFCKLRKLGNTLKKPGTQILVEAVRRYAAEVFGEEAQAAEKPEEYGLKVQKRLFQ